MEDRAMARLRGGSPVYDEWMEKEGIPIYREMTGIEDITELPRRPWARTGGLGTFIELEATRAGWKELYVAEIPPGKALEPERHLYDELIYVVEGRGLAEVWQEGSHKVSFEWGEGSIFAIPLNAWHRFVNGGRNRVLIFAQSCAPVAMNLYRNVEFIFNCDYKFTDRFSGKGDYFAAGKEGRSDASGYRWNTNFVPDVRKAVLGDFSTKVEAGLGGEFNMVAWSGGVGMSEWPVGRYHKAHFHGAGAILLGLNSEGYVLLWPKELGIHPYQDGHGDQVVKQPWRKNSIYSPQSGWFHQHLNTGKEPAAHFRTTGGGIGIMLPTIKQRAMAGKVATMADWAPFRVIEHEDEDPQIRKDFAEELKRKGIKLAMNLVTYRPAPL